MLITGLVTAKNFEYHASSPIHNSAGVMVVTMLDLWNYRAQQPLAVKSEPSACQPKTHASMKTPYAMLQVITKNDLSRATACQSIVARFVRSYLAWKHGTDILLNYIPV